MTATFRGAILAAGLMMAWQVAAKAARDSLFLSVFPPTALPAVVGAGAVCSILMAVWFSRMLVRFGPHRVVPVGYLVGGLLHGFEWILLPHFPRMVSTFVYIHVVGLGTLLLSGFWTLASERFNPREARKRFGQIAAFGTLGSLAGGVIAERIAFLTSSAQLLLLLAALQFACFVVLLGLGSVKAAEKPQEALSFPEVISGAPYLVRLAGFVILVAMSAATLDYLFKFQAFARFGRGPELSRFFALFYAGTSALTFVVQAGLTRSWLNRFGPGRTVAVLPVAVTGASLVSLLFPGAATLAVSRAIEQLLRGSLFRSGYELFFTPMPQAEKRSAKSVIDIGADRLGDGLAAAAIQLFLALPAAVSSQAILVLTAVLSGLAAWVAFRLDRAYVAVLEKGLINHTVTVTPEEAEDFVTKTIVLRTLPAVAGPSPRPRAAAPDATMRQLADLRSGDPGRVQAVLHTPAPLDPLLVPQVIQLLGRDETARAAHEALTKMADRVAGQLVDCLADSSADVKVRRRLPRILASCRSWVAWNGLFRQLGDERFEIRQRCGKALEKMLERYPEHRPTPEAIFDLVGRELVNAGSIWRHHRETNAAQSGRLGMVNEVVRERASQTMTHISTLLALVLPPQSVRLAFRALQTEDSRLAGVALEYLDSVLPKTLAAQFCAQIEGAAASRKTVHTQEALSNLLDSSPSIMARLEELGFDRSEEDPGAF